MTVTATVDASGARAKLEQFRKTVAAHTGARCVITPTQVIYYHCLAKSSGRDDSLLNRMPASAHADVERRWKPKVEQATRESVRRITGQTSGTTYESAIARVWRYGAYLMIDRLWAEVKKGAWGQIEESSEYSKVNDIQGAHYRMDEATAARGRTVRTRGAGALSWVTNYGVRQLESGRRWYEVQKGRSRHGKRTDGDLNQSPPVIEVKVGARVISSV